jgi:hypothetical protein
MKRRKPSFRRLEEEIREVLALTLDLDMIDPILQEAEHGNPAAQFIVADALESLGRPEEASEWFHSAADQGYGPALERLRRLPFSAA